ncbi:hypothetical protein [uncultured Streptomyces sp.]|uniref:hypothetical protein n=1 Tax=uncultured Streptomyces sp. TaxID=174707 RepID=UPI00261B26C1|nr:hypothetical protein [uncultured Streptomyces sp.]
MEAELAALAASGATALVGHMVEESWTQARGRVARFFARRGGAEPPLEGELDESREDLLAARDAEDVEAAADVEAQWRARMRRTLRADPAAADELRSLLAELERDTGTVPGREVHNTITGDVHGPVVQGRTFHGLTFHTGAPGTAFGGAASEPPR